MSQKGNSNVLNFIHIFLNSLRQHSSAQTSFYRREMNRQDDRSRIVMNFGQTILKLPQANACDGHEQMRWLAPAR